MTSYLFDEPATDEQFKGYRDLDLTNDERIMANVVAKKISFREFQNVKNRYKQNGWAYSDRLVLEDLYDDIRQYHPKNDIIDSWLPASKTVLDKLWSYK